MKEALKRAESEDEDYKRKILLLLLLPLQCYSSAELLAYYLDLTMLKEKGKQKSRRKEEDS